MRVGMIGYNEGNGHPYSFSAIINGYDPIEMKTTNYPQIARYLSKRNKEEFGVKSLSVTHVWTPDWLITETIAKSCFIPNPVKDYQEMIGFVDSVIVARDDARIRNYIVVDFIKHGIPVFVDKPLCLTFGELNFFKKFINSNLIYTASATRFHFPLNDKNWLRYVRENTDKTISFYPVNWEKYGIHILEHLVHIFGANLSINQVTPYRGENMNQFLFENGIESIIMKSDINELRTKFYKGDRIIFDLVIDDNFGMFKEMLLDFHNFLITGLKSFNNRETQAILEGVIQGLGNGK